MVSRRHALAALTGLSARFLSGRHTNFYRAGVERWQNDHDDQIRGPEGPFTLVDRLYPKPGSSTLGSDRSCDLRVAVPRAPAHIGHLEVNDGTAILHLLPGVKATMDNLSVDTIVVKGSDLKNIVVSGVKLTLRFSGNECRLSISDSESPARLAAPPLQWFPIQEKYCIEAEWTPFHQSKSIQMADSDGGKRDWQVPGVAAFTLDGQRLTLNPVSIPGDDELFFAFRDATSAHETYGSGRFLGADQPKAGRIVLDFNKAYNPLCIYNHLYTCPIPPRGNHLAAAVRAGERLYAPAEVH